MKRTFFIFATLMMLLFCSTVFAQSTLVDMEFDVRPWEIGFEKSDDSQTMVEYVIKGEKIEDWNELITIQIFHTLDEKSTPERFMEIMKNTALQNYPGIRWEVLDLNQKTALYEWELKGQTGIPDQYEIAHIFKGEKGVYVIHYASKRHVTAKELRKKWLKILKKAKEPKQPEQ